MIPAKLPAKFIRNPEVHLEDLSAGESGWVDWLEMAVDREYNCFIDPQARIHNSRTLTTVRVTRTAGGFEVRIPTGRIAPPLRWELSGYDLKKYPESYKRYVPVARVEEEPGGGRVSGSRARKRAGQETVKNKMMLLMLKLKHHEHANHRHPGRRRPGAGEARKPVEGNLLPRNPE
jgi:hypothetical protein